MFKRMLCLILILLMLPLSATQTSLDRNFFVNTANGQPRVKVVYGQYAAEQDYENALEIAEWIANKLCVVISERPQYFSPKSLEETAPSDLEIALSPEEYPYLWYSGKPSGIRRTNEGYNEIEPHEEIRFKADLPNYTLLYLEYVITNIEPGDDIRFLGETYHVDSIEEDRLVYGEGQIVSWTETPYWYNTDWFLKVSSNELRLYRENMEMTMADQLKTPEYSIEDGKYKWQLTFNTEWKDTSEFYYELQCGLAYRLNELEREKIPVGVDPHTMLIRDTELTMQMKNEYNLILVGGPGMVLQSSGK
ncbi:MAG: hypothetical protein U9N35_00890, partial [Euryarchaeota archaeon]|nr:hypothetical protein [Euryarchaeota archaeon]